MGEIENVRVFVRVRPLSKREETEGCDRVVLMDPIENLIAVTRNESRPYKFDQIFDESITQLMLYRTVAGPIVDKVLKGYNGTIFTYGQTGTGKTYTMTGGNTPDTRGVIPNAFAHIFGQISAASVENLFVVTATYLEIYNEEVRDLLSPEPDKKLTIRERSDVGVYVKDLMGFVVESIDGIVELLTKGNKNRITRSTMMNDVSSRAHAIFTVTIESRNRATNKTIVGKLNLVDLAGSERASRTQATGERLKEASNINLSLSVLGNVISALVDGKSTHIPYRNSKLTRLLQDSLGGNSKTAMIATISPADIDMEETICTLRYAARVKHIQNHARINVEQKGLIESFEQEIADLQEKVNLLSVQEEKPIKQKRREKIVSEEIRKCEEELAQTEKAKNDILQKISNIQKKILSGGENLFEKAQHQAFLLDASGLEIENLDRSHRQLEATLSQKGAERIDVEEKYSSLQEEDVGITRKIETVQALLNEVREEYADKEHEYQREMEVLLDNNRLLLRETQLASLMIDNYIPKEYLKQIEGNIMWNPETQEFQMKGVAYTGNNMRKRSAGSVDIYTPIRLEIKSVYHKYPERKKERKLVDRRVYSAIPKSR